MKFAAAKAAREKAAKAEEDARIATAAASKLKREEDKIKLLDQIETDKQAAIDAAVDAALQEQAAK